MTSESSRNARSERRALKMSVVGALFLAVLGFAFFLPTDSEAVLLDGFFSLIGFAMGLLSLRVAQLVQFADDRHFQFGYAAFEPMLNTIKGLIILAVCLFAGIAAVGAIIDGGRSIQAGWGLFYAMIAAVSCFTLAGLQSRVAARTGSQLVAVDARTWLVDGTMSLVAALAFGVATAISDTRWAAIVPYVDPGLVLLMAVLLLPMPVKIVASGAGELLKVAPKEETQDRVRAGIREVLTTADMIEHRVRMVRVGREFWVLVHVLVPSDRQLGSAADLDLIRGRVHQRVATIAPGLVTDVIFTAHREWM